MTSWDEAVAQDIFSHGAIKKMVLHEGDGRHPEFKEEAVIRYCMCAVKALDGQGSDVLEKSEEREISIFVGQKDVAPAVELAVKGMKEGEMALVRGDPRFAYGEEGRPPLIPPNSHVQFAVELVECRGPRKDVNEMTLAEKVEYASKRKALGNDFFGVKEYYHALRCYNEANEVCVGDYAAAVIQERNEKADTYSSSKKDKEKLLMCQLWQLGIDCGNNTATVLYKQKKLKEAKEVCVTVLQTDFDNFKALLRGGQIANFQGEYEEATIALKRALDIQPDHKAAQAEWRLLQKRKKEYKERKKKMFKKQGKGLTSSTSKTTASALEKEAAEAMEGAAEAKPKPKPKRTKAQAREEALDRVDVALSGLADDELFQSDLKDPQVQRAVLHWTGKVRLPPQQAHNAKFHHDYKVVQVLQKMRQLQATCRDADMGVPIDNILKGERFWRTPKQRAQRQAQKKAMAEAAGVEVKAEEESTKGAVKQEQGQLEEEKEEEKEEEEEVVEMGEDGSFDFDAKEEKRAEAKEGDNIGKSKGDGDISSANSSDANTDTMPLHEPFSKGWWRDVFLPHAGQQLLWLAVSVAFAAIVMHYRGPAVQIGDAKWDVEGHGGL